MGGVLIKIEGFAPQDVADIEHAFSVARVAHRGQFRASGEPYISHPVAVADILYDAGIRDPKVFVLALIHDVDEDSSHLHKAPVPLRVTVDRSWDRLAGSFDSEIADDMFHITEPSYRDKRKQAVEYHFLVETGSERVWLVKLADRLHNLRTLGAMPVEKQKKKIDETKRYYLPIFQKAAAIFPREAGPLLSQLTNEIAALENFN